MRVRGEEEAAALVHKAGNEASSSLSFSVPISDSKTFPLRAQVTEASSSASSTSSSSADEEFDPQLSLQSKVTILDQPKRALAGGDCLPSRFQNQCGLQLQWFR